MAKNNHLLYHVYANVVYNESYLSKRHQHNYYELYYLINGRRIYSARGKEYEVLQDAVTLTKPNVPHATRGGTFSRYVIYFSESFLALYFKEDYVKKLLQCFDKDIIRLKNSNRVRILMESMLKHYNLADYDMFSLTLANILVELGRISENDNENFTDVKHDSLISKVISYLNVNAAEIKSLDEIASRFFISKYYLSRLFKQVMRTTIFDYIANCKLNKAIRCLQHTDKTVNEIALECGFNSTAYFCKIFRSAMGVTPGRYRIILKEEGERPFQD